MAVPKGRQPHGDNAGDSQQRLDVILCRSISSVSSTALWEPAPAEAANPQAAMHRYVQQHGLQAHTAQVGSCCTALLFCVQLCYLLLPVPASSPLAAPWLLTHWGRAEFQSVNHAARRPHLLSSLSSHFFLVS